MFLTFTAGVNFTSCDNLFSEDSITEPETEQAEELPVTKIVTPGASGSSQSAKSGKIKFLINSENQENQNQRSILPDVQLANLTAITITGTHNGTSVGIADNLTYSQLTSQYFELELGEWSFSLTAQNEGFDFTSTGTVTVDYYTTNTVSFSLSPSTAAGGFSFSLDFTGNAPKAEFSLTPYPSGSTVDSGEISTENHKVVYNRSSSNPLPPGTYRFAVTFYGDAEKAVTLNTYSELITIKDGFVSKSQSAINININSMYEISYDFAGGTLDSGTLVEKYSIHSSPISLPSAGSNAVKRQGYDFAGWKEGAAEVTEINLNEPRNYSLTAQWTPRNDTAYKVEHYKQNINDNNYVLENTDNLTGTTAWNTEASAKDTTTQTSDYYGFTAKTFSQSAIAADGSTIVKIYYDRNTYKITYKSGVSEETIAVPSTQTGIRFGATVTPDFTTTVTRAGYNFAGWSDGTTIYTSGGTFEMPATNIILTAQWTPASGIQYKIKHMWQDTTGSTYTLHETETQTGTTGYPTSAASYIKTNYTGFNTPSASSVTEEAIAADGTTEVEIRYTRKTYTLSYAMNGGSGTIASSTVRYGAPVTPDFTTTVSNTGYTFAGWKNGSTTYTSGDTFPMPNNDVTLTAQWTPVTYTITYETNEGVFKSTYTKPESYTVESPVTLPTSTNITKTGYTLDGWYANASFTGSKITTTDSSTTGNKIYYAKWTPATVTYMVKHYQQNLDNNNYSIVSSANETKTGLTGSNTTATPKSSFTGFEAKDFEQAVIKADGTTVVEIYYDRILYPVTYSAPDKTGGNMPSSSNTYRYGKTITIPSIKPERNGYSFEGWSDGTNTYGIGASIAINEERSFTAVWKKRKFTITYRDGTVNNPVISDSSSYWVSDYIPPREFYVDSADIILPNANNMKRTNYVFGGWYTTYDGTGDPITTLPTGSYLGETESEKVIVAKWIAVSSAYALVNGNYCSTASDICTALTTANSTDDIELVLYGNVTQEEIGKASDDGTITNAIKNTTANSVSFKTLSSSKITITSNFYSVFSNCTKLVSVDLSGITLESGCKSIMFMFSGCTNLVSVNISALDTSNITSMHGMFQDCKSLPSVDLSNFKTTNIDSLTSMFTNCKEMETIDLSKFELNSSKFKSMSSAFAGCTKLKTIYVNESKFDMSGCSTASNMFKDCSSNLKGGAGTTWSNSNPMDQTYARVDKGSSSPGYFTNKN